MAQKRKAQALAEGSVSAYAARQASQSSPVDAANKAASIVGQIEHAYKTFNGDAPKKRAKKPFTRGANFEHKIPAPQDGKGQQTPYDRQPIKEGFSRPDPLNHTITSERLAKSALFSKISLNSSISASQWPHAKSLVAAKVEGSPPKPQNNDILNCHPFSSAADLNAEGLHTEKRKISAERQMLESQNSQHRENSASLVLPSEASGTSTKKRGRRMKFQGMSIPTMENSNVNYVDSGSKQERQMDISKDFEDFTSSTESSDHPRPIFQQLSAFKQIPHTALGESSTEWTVRIQEGDFLTLIGQYDIWVRKGAISIAGAMLRASSQLHRVYAPSTHALPMIRASRNPFSPQGNAEITVISCTSGLRALRHLSPKFDGIWNFKVPSTPRPESSEDLSLRTFTFLEYSSDHRHKQAIHALQISDSWQSSMVKLVSNENSQQPQAVLVCGPKGSGKSTFCRSLTNAMISKLPLRSPSGQIISRTGCVALLDIDPGQPEYSPPGEVSLILVRVCNFGIPFSHPTTTPYENEMIRSHHVGSISPSDDPEFYVRCISNLYERYKELLTQISFCPLVINTAGWIQGRGLELVVDLIHNLSLTDVVYTSIEGPLEVLEVITKAAIQSGIQLHCVNSQPAQYSTKSAADLRIMQALSYIHLDEPENGRLHWNSTPVTDLIPLSVHYAGPSQSFFGIHIPGDEVDPGNITRVLEGSMVGLVAIENDAALPMMGEENKRVSSNTDGDSDTNSLSQTQGNIDTRNSGHSDDHLQDCADAHASTNTIPETPRKAYLSIPTLPRTPEMVPYIPSAYGTTPPLDPNHSYSIGQAIIHSIDSTQKLFRLITPVPTAIFNALHRQEIKIVLVRGKLDLPTWAYREELSVLAMARKTTIKERTHDAELERWGREDVKRWAEGKPWATIEGRGRGERVRRARKDFGKKASRDEMSK